MYKRRSTRKRTSRKRTRKNYKPRMLRKVVPRTNALTIKRKFFLRTWTWGTTTTSDFWRYQGFFFSDIPNFSELASVFDTYRVNAIKFTYMPRYTSTNAEAAGTTGSPQAYAHYIVDPDSTLIPAGIYGSATTNQLLENTGCKTRQLNKPFSVYYKPKVLQAYLGGGTGAAARSPPFVRTSDVNVDFRGHHMYIQQNNFSASANANIILDIFVTVYMTLKNVR